MSTPYQSPRTDPSPPTRRRIWPFVLSGCLVVALLMVIACGGLMYFGFRQVSGQGDIALEVDRFFRDIDQGRAAEYYRTRTTAEFQGATSEEQFIDLANIINEKLGQFQSKSVSGFYMRADPSGRYVDATYTCQFQHGSGTLKATFKHDDAHWMLHGFNLDSPRLVETPAHEKCPHCGETYEAGAKFCPHCGKEIAATEGAAEP